MRVFKNKYAFGFILLFVSFSANSQIDSTQKSWRFNVFLDDTPIGYHLFELKHIDNKSQVSIKAEFDVKFLFFSVYSYLHENTEIWEGQCLKTLSSNTNDNGDDVFVNLRSQDNKTLIETSNSTNTTNQCIRSFAYWNPELLKSKQLLNAQNGELIEIDFSHIGKDTLNLNNQDIESEHYRILGKNIEIDLWYSNDKHWLALQSKTEDGYLLRYELQTEVGK